MGWLGWRYQEGRYREIGPVGVGLGGVLVGRSLRRIGFADAEVGGGLAGRLRGCVRADALVGVGVGGYLRGFGGRWCVVVGGVGWFGLGVAVLLVLEGGFFLDQKLEDTPKRPIARLHCILVTSNSTARQRCDRVVVVGWLT